MLWMNPHHRTRERLSAYIDRQLPPGAARAVEAHLASCEECRTEVDDLRATVRALQTLPPAEPRLSFALTPEMAGTPVRPSPARSMAPVQTGMRLAAAGLAVALAVVFVADAGNVGQDRNDDEARTSLGFLNIEMASAGTPATGGVESFSGDNVMREGDAVPTAGDGAQAGVGAPTAEGQSGAGYGPGAPGPAAGELTPTPTEGVTRVLTIGSPTPTVVPGSEAPPLSPEVTPTPDAQELAGNAPAGSSEGDITPSSPPAPPSPDGEEPSGLGPGDAPPEGGVLAVSPVPLPTTETEPGAATEALKANALGVDGSSGGEELSPLTDETRTVPSDGGAGTLLIVEIALAIALAVVLGGSVALAVAGRRR